MIWMPDGTYCGFDERGRLRVRFGNLIGVAMADLVYHQTLDGDYVDGVVMAQGAHSPDNLSKYRNTYAGHQSWCFYANGWYTLPAAGIGMSRWEGCTTNSVPECVRMAEMLR